MFKAKKVNANEWEYRGGSIEHLPKACGRRENWRWDCCGVGGWTNNKAEAKQKIDCLLAMAREILQKEAQ